MNKRNAAIGVFLILLGISMYLRNFNISTSSLITLFLGLGLLYAYRMRGEEPLSIFGGIFTAIGIISVMRDIRLFRIDMTFEAVLITLGIIFILIYYSRDMQGFLFPGMMLPAIGIYLILLKLFNDRYVFPSIFLLLGFAFYAMYFIGYMEKSSWPLIPATILLLTGILYYAFSFRIITWSMIYMNQEYIWPLLMVAAGILILLNRLRKRI